VNDTRDVSLIFPLPVNPKTFLCTWIGFYFWHELKNFEMQRYRKSQCF